MRFVQRDFEHPRDDLHAARETLRRRKDESDILRRNAAIMRDFRGNFARRRPVGFKHESRAEAVSR